MCPEFIRRLESVEARPMAAIFFPADACYFHDRRASAGRRSLRSPSDQQPLAQIEDSLSLTHLSHATQSITAEMRGKKVHIHTHAELGDPAGNPKPVL
jgi:hypothetical protein